MDRVEKYINDCTRNCSNELAAVEDKCGKKVISYHEWLTPDNAREVAHIARSELANTIKNILATKSNNLDRLNALYRILDEEE